MVDYYEFNIGSHYLPALINGDESGLDAGEEIVLEQFCFDAEERMKSQFNVEWFHWTYSDEEVFDFGRCECSGLLNQLANVKLVFNGTKR